MERKREEVLQANELEDQKVTCVGNSSLVVGEAPTAIKKR